MSKLGKILGPIVAILSIAAAVLSFLIANQRVLFRDRAATLATTVASMTAKLDEGSGSGLKNKISFTAASANSPKEGGSLGWESYKTSQKAADGNYEKTVKQAVELSEKVQKQRNDLAAALLEMAVSLEYPAKMLPPAENLTSLDKYAAVVPQMDEYAKSVTDRDKQILKNINGIAALVRSSVRVRPVGVDGNTGKVQKVTNVQQSFVPMKNAVQLLSNREAELVKAVSSAVGTIKAYKGWTVSTKKLNRTSHQELKNQLNKFNSDCRKINTLLGQVEVWKKDIQRIQSEKKKYEDRIASLKDEKEKIEKRLAQFEKKFGNFDNPVDMGIEKKLPVLDKKIDVPLNLAGKILKVNKEMSYVMLDLTNRQVVKGLSLAVVRKGVYIATVTVYEAGDNFSMANILSGEIGELKKDDDVIISALDLKKIQDIKTGKDEEED